MASPDPPPLVRDTAPAAEVLSAHSKFNPALAQLHVREALEFLALCERTGQPLLDPCGPRGDLYFLLKTMVAPGVA